MELNTGAGCAVPCTLTHPSPFAVYVKYNHSGYGGYAVHLLCVMGGSGVEYAGKVAYALRWYISSLLRDAPNVFPVDIADITADLGDILAVKTGSSQYYFTLHSAKINNPLNQTYCWQTDAETAQELFSYCLLSIPLHRQRWLKLQLAFGSFAWQKHRCQDRK